MRKKLSRYQYRGLPSGFVAAAFLELFEPIVETREPIVVYLLLLVDDILMGWRDVFSLLFCFPEYKLYSV